MSYAVGEHTQHECPRCGVRAIFRTFKGFSCDNCGATFSPARWGSNSP